jgi:F0F1-type ATP synthase assembly protein I
MKNDKLPQNVLIAYSIAALFIGWVILKGMVIGFYPDEMVPLIIVPLVLGLIAMGVGKVLHQRADDAAGNIR